MNDFEIKLKSLKLKEPSGMLRNKIFKDALGGGTHARKRSLFFRRIPFGIAAIFSILMGLLGFYISYLVDKDAKNAEGASSEVKVQIIYKDSSAQNAFDFTQNAPVIFEGEAKVKINSDKEA